MAASIRLRRLPPNDRSISRSGNRDDDLSRGVTAFRSEMGRANSSPTTPKGLAQNEFRFIPSDPTAIEVGLSHASRTPPDYGGGVADCSVTRS